MFEQVSPVLSDFIVAVLTGLLSLLCAFLLGLAKKGFDFLSSKIDKIADEKAQDALFTAKANLEDIVTSTVTALQQTLADNIKESIAANDGQYTKEDLYALADTALKSIKVQLTESSKEALATAYSDLDGFIRDRIESKVYELKNGLMTAVEIEDE